MGLKTDMSLLAHLFRRAGFGATHDELKSCAAKGYETTVEELLHPESQPPLEEDLLLRLYPGQQGRVGYDRNQTYWAYKMINTRRPLEEKIALFWHGVHCTAHSKVEFGRQMTVTVDLFRRYGLGNFRYLLLEVAKDPGMIFFLDNNLNHKKGINENWGRELLELFSMGVGNYTEDDVKEAARGFTGWTLAPTFPQFPWHRAATWEFLYDTTRHDNAPKAFLGREGKFNGDDIVDIICQQPATARFIARHLYNFFVADEPPVPQWANTPPRDPQAIEVLAQAYFDANYDICAMLRVLFYSDVFKNARFTKVKSPTEVVIGTLRLVKDFTSPSPYLINVARQCEYMGQELYNPPTVEGWHTGQEWIDSGTLVERVNFLSSQLGDTSKEGIREIAQQLSAMGEWLTPEEFVEGCVEQLGGVPLSDETERTLIEFAGRGGSINTRTEEFISGTAAIFAVLASTKEYQLN